MAFRRVDSPAVALAGGFPQDDVDAQGRTTPIRAAAPANTPTLVSIEQASALAGVSRRTIYLWIKRGLVRTQRVASGRMRIETASLFKPAA